MKAVAAPVGSGPEHLALEFFSRVWSECWVERSALEAYREHLQSESTGTGGG